MSELGPQIHETADGDVLIVDADGREIATLCNRRPYREMLELARKMLAGLRAKTD